MSPWDTGICVCTRPDLQPLAAEDGTAVLVAVTSGAGPHFVLLPIAVPQTHTQLQTTP